MSYKKGKHIENNVKKRLSYISTYNIFLLSDAPKCSYKGPQRIYGAIGEKILLVCDVTPFPQGRNLKFQWNFQEGGSTKSNKILRTNQGFQN